MHTYGLSSPGPYDTGRSFLLPIYSAEHDTQGKLHLGSVPHPYLIYTSDNDGPVWILQVRLELELVSSSNSSPN
jgi:hypothetical protein